jgi:hypothetical protein
LRCLEGVKACADLELHSPGEHLNRSRDRTGLQAGAIPLHLVERRKVHERLATHRLDRHGRLGKGQVRKSLTNLRQRRDRWRRGRGRQGSQRAGLSVEPPREAAVVLAPDPRVVENAGRVCCRHTHGHPEGAVRRVVVRIRAGLVPAPQRRPVFVGVLRRQCGWRHPVLGRARVSRHLLDRQPDVGVIDGLLPRTARGRLWVGGMCCRSR